MRILLTLAAILISSALQAAMPAVSDTVSGKKVKKGWTVGGVPAIAFDSDVGFKYGAVVNFYNFGDGSTYPKYKHSIYLEWSRTTKGSGINQFTYDSEFLIPGIRLSAEASLFTEQALDFYGFNGYATSFTPTITEMGGDDYISRMFYRVDRKRGKLMADFYGNIVEKRLKWLFGIEYTSHQLGTVDIDRLNRGRAADKLLPDTALLYDKYVEWGLISPTEADGGDNTLAKIGIVYDTRDNEPNPMSGLWSDAQLLLAPGFMNTGRGYGRVALTHRQYYTLVPARLSFAYRLSYQAHLWGQIPWYMLPYVYNTAPNMTRDGLGGAKTIRGVLRNRVVGEAFAYGNFEGRYKVLRTILLNQNFYISLNAFSDMGMVVKPYAIDLSGVPEPDKLRHFNERNDALHIAYGLGLRFVLNENFVVAVDYGISVKQEDGGSGLYIGLNFLY